MFLHARKLWHPYPCCKAVAGEGGPAVSSDTSAKNNVLRAAPSQPSAGVIDALSSALASARATFSSLLDLIALEARRALLAVIWMVALGLVAALCLVAAWVGLMGALVIGAISFGLTPVFAVISVTLLNVAAAAVLISMGVGKSRDLLFSATRRQVAGNSPIPPTTP
jgi:hypothetical protein